MPGKRHSEQIVYAFAASGRGQEGQRNLSDLMLDKHILQEGLSKKT